MDQNLFIGTVFSESGSSNNRIADMLFPSSLSEATLLTRLRFSNARVLVSARHFCLIELVGEKRRIFIGSLEC